MASNYQTVNMNLTIPVPTQELGPDYAFEINTDLTIVDGHNHSTGSGVQINPSGLNINATLPINNNILQNVGSVNFQGQSMTPPPQSLYAVLNGDLYYIGTGSAVQITNGSSLAGAAGTITGLPSGTASAAYSAGTFVFQAATSQAANIDAGNYFFRNQSPNSTFAVEVSAPNLLSTNYQIFLPGIPAVDNSPVLMDTSGNLYTGNPNDYFMPAGLIMAYGGTTIPGGWLLCDSTAVSRTTYANLFAVIGTAFGAGNGTTTFNLPDFRGLFLRGVSGTSGNDPNAAARGSSGPGGATGNNVGSFQPSGFGSHTHTDSGHTHTVIAKGGANLNAFSAGGDAGDPTTLTQTTSVGHAVITATGGSETRPSNIYVNYIIKI